MDLTFHQLTEAEIPLADTIAVAAYRMTRSRAPELRRDLPLEPEGWYLVRADGRPVGLGGAINYDVFAYIGLISVLPDQQRQGIATRLMHHLLDWVSSRGCSVALLDASTMGQPLYTQLGFVVDDASEVWQASPEISATLSTRSAVEFLDHTHLSELVAYDAPRFGANRSRVLAALLRDHPERVIATRDVSGQISGFAVAQERLIGPWLADAPDAAETLLATALTLPFVAPPSVFIPALNSHGTGLLARAGFTRQRALSHMRLGTLSPRRTREQHYGLTSFALG